MFYNLFHNVPGVSIQRTCPRCVSNQGKEEEEIPHAFILKEEGQKGERKGEEVKGLEAHHVYSVILRNNHNVLHIHALQSSGNWRFRQPNVYSVTDNSTSNYILYSDCTTNRTIVKDHGTVWKPSMYNVVPLYQQVYCIFSVYSGNDRRQPSL